MGRRVLRTLAGQVAAIDHRSVGRARAGNARSRLTTSSLRYDFARHARHSEATRYWSVIG